MAYPLGLKGVVVAEGDTYDEALSEVKSAIAFHLETFGPDVLECAVKQAYDYQYNRQLAIYYWDMRYKELTDVERADIQIEIGNLRNFQEENGFGPWYHEDE